MAHSELPIFQQECHNTPLYALRSISGEDSEDSPISDSGSNTEYQQVLLNILRIFLGTNCSDETSERRERAGSIRIATTLQKHDKCGPASRHRFSKLVTD